MIQLEYLILMKKEILNHLFVMWMTTDLPSNIMNNGKKQDGKHERHRGRRRTHTCKTIDNIEVGF